VTLKVTGQTPPLALKRSVNGVAPVLEWVTPLPTTSGVDDTYSAVLQFTNPSDNSIFLNTLPTWTKAQPADFPEDATTTCTGSLAAHDSCTYTQTFTPLSTGSKSLQAHFNLGGTTGPYFDSPITTSTAITPPTMSASWTTPLPAQSFIGRSHDAVLTVTNTSDETLNLQSPTWTKADSTDFPDLEPITTCGTTLASGAQCTYKEEYRPLNVGTKSLNVVVHYSDAAGSYSTAPTAATESVSKTLILAAGYYNSSVSPYYNKPLIEQSEDNGQSWTQVTGLPTFNAHTQLNDIKWLNNRWIAVGVTGSISNRVPFILTSLDGSTWQEHRVTGATTPSAFYVSHIAWNGANYIITATQDSTVLDGNLALMIKGNATGTTWTTVNLPSPSTTDLYGYTINGLTWDGSKYLAIGRSKYTTPSELPYAVESTDGESWSVVASNKFPAFSEPFLTFDYLMHHADTYYSIGYTGDGSNNYSPLMMTKTEEGNWSIVTLPDVINNGFLRSMAYADGNYIAVGTETDLPPIVFIKIGTANWSRATLSAVANDDALIDVTSYSTSDVVAVGFDAANGPLVLHSANAGIDWSKGNISKVDDTNTFLYAVGAN
jgi:hypothetical protein